MTDRNPSPSVDGAASPGSASRRAFLLAVGSSVGLGLTPTAAGGNPSDAEAGPITVGAAPAQRDAVRAATEALREAGPDSPVAVSVPGTTAGLERFTDGDLDVLAGNRPMLPAERASADDSGIDCEQRELPAATAALRHPGSTWVDCLSPAQLTESWAGDGPIETWAEAAAPGATDAVTRTEPVETSTDGTEAGEDRSDWAPIGDRSGRNPTALVRGVRAYQYASGFGGLGYYEPPGDGLVPSSAVSSWSDEPVTPVVRLSYLFADRSSPRWEAVDAFLQAFVDRGTRGVEATPLTADLIE